MYCRNCGSQIDENVQYCPYCGAAARVEDPGLNYSDAKQSATTPEKKNGWAVAGFVLALVSILGSMLLAVLGIVFSAIGTAHKKDCTAYNALAKAGLIISIITAALWLIVLIAVIVAVV